MFLEYFSVSTLVNNGTKHLENNMQQSTKHHPKESKCSLGYTSKEEDGAMITAPHTQTTLFPQRNSSRKKLCKDLIVSWQCSDCLWCIIFLNLYLFSEKVPCSLNFSSLPSTCESEVKKESWLRNPWRWTSGILWDFFQCLLLKFLKFLWKDVLRKDTFPPNITKSTDLFVHLLIFTCGFQHVQIPVFHHTGAGDT